VTITAELSKVRPDDVEALAVGVVAGAVEEAAGAFEGVDAATVSAFLAAQGFEAEHGQVCAAPAGAGTVWLVGLGDADDLDAQRVRAAMGCLARTASRHASLAVDVGAVGERVAGPDLAQAVAEGVALGAYRYDELKSSATPHALERLVLLAGGGKRVQDALDRGLGIAAAVCVARDLVNEPGGSLTPRRFAQVVERLGATHGFEVEAWDDKRIKAEKMGGLLGVNRGSQQPARFLALRHEPERARSTLALVGKGITFDSGGLSIKPSEGMIGMKGDMAGAAAVVGAFVAAATVGSRVRLLGFIPLTDNMTGPDATRVGDVLTIRGGKTVEVLNTDAEGRLVLADALQVAADAEPDAIVDLATLTGACMVALGDRIAGAMGTHQGLVEQVRTAADAAGEPVWPLPLPVSLRPQLDSEIADLKNIGNGRYGGTLTAGLFLKEFVPETMPWVHLDIAGPAFRQDVDGELPKGGTGFGVRTLARLVTSFAKPKPADR
jgi:leucyl aminopeptidase